MIKISTLFISTAVALSLTGCGAIKAKLAKLQMHSAKLANGKTLYMDINVEPTADWGCKIVGNEQHWNWAKLREHGMEHFSNGFGMIEKRAIAVANKQKLNANYALLYIPGESRAQTGRVSYSLNHGAMATATFYQCKKINPDNEVGVMSKTTYSSSLVGSSFGGGL